MASHLTLYLRRTLCLLLILSVLPLWAFAADGPGLDAFAVPDPLPEPEFSDVSIGSWYDSYVGVVQYLGLMEGTGENIFSPNGTVPLSQGLAVAVRIYEIYHGLEDLSQDYEGPWYRYYVDRAREYDILPQQLQDETFTRSATKAELGEILSRCLPKEELEAKLDIASIPDYGGDEPYFNGVLILYQAGVLTGDKKGYFHPHANIRRCELAAMVTRLVCPQYRLIAGNDELPPGAPGMDAFRLPEPLPELSFQDLEDGRWYITPVQHVCALGLMNGVEDTIFRPNGTVAVSQVVAVAVRVYEQYMGLPDESDEYGETWYDYYMDRAKKYGILPSAMRDVTPTRSATRAEVAAILYGALPLSELETLNQIDTLPDYDSEQLYWDEVLTLYRAGILTGSDEYGRFYPNKSIRRSELATLLDRLTQKESRETLELKPLPAPYFSAIVYGTSGAGRNLVAYRFGQGENVLVVTFAIHGWEDNFPRDGQLLVDTANALCKTLESRYDTLVKDGNWSVYVFPCLNPDGLLDGWTHNGPGRCTTHGPNGRGIDMNRCFPYNFSPSYTDRNYTGDSPLQAVEAQALHRFVKSIRGQGHNVLIDVHGWFNQIICSTGREGQVYQAMKESFPSCQYTSLAGGRGYFSAWAGYTQGFEACLLEFPHVSSAADFHNQNLDQRFVEAISTILTTYN